MPRYELEKLIFKSLVAFYAKQGIEGSEELLFSLQSQAEFLACALIDVAG